MDLKNYIKFLPDEASREDFARRCKTSLGHLRNVSYGKRCDELLAADIERESAGLVPRQVLCPDTWARAWPELALDAASEEIVVYGTTSSLTDAERPKA